MVVPDHWTSALSLDVGYQIFDIGLIILAVQKLVYRFTDNYWCGINIKIWIQVL